MKLEKDHAIIETISEDSALREQVGGVQGTATRAEVLQAITPKEGDAVFVWWDDFSDVYIDGSPWGIDDECPEYSTQFDKETWKLRGLQYVKANALTIGKTVGELREMLTWAKGDA